MHTYSGPVMGVADLKNAFNVATAGRFTCQRATLGYEHVKEVEVQRLTFTGIDSDGKPFEARSDRIPAGSDPVIAARQTAVRMIEKADAEAAAVAQARADAIDKSED